MTKHYSNGEITVVWKPDICSHSGVCARGLPEVFRPKLKPWIDLTPADSAAALARLTRNPKPISHSNWTENCGLPTRRTATE